MSLTKDKSFNEIASLVAGFQPTNILKPIRFRTPTFQFDIFMRQGLMAVYRGELVGVQRKKNGKWKKTSSAQLLFSFTGNNDMTSR